MTKTVNYTPEMTTALVEAYTAATSEAARKGVVADFAGMFGKSTKSIVAKLSKENVYVPAKPVGKKGGIKKADLVDAIVEMVPMAESDADSLNKATMKALSAIKTALADAEDAS